LENLEAALEKLKSPDMSDKDKSTTLEEADWCMHVFEMREE